MRTYLHLILLPFSFVLLKLIIGFLQHRRQLLVLHGAISIAHSSSASLGSFLISELPCFPVCVMRKNTDPNPFSAYPNDF